MVALILTICVIATAYILTIKEIKRSEGNFSNTSHSLSLDQYSENDKENKVEGTKEDGGSYYERFISKRNDGNNFIDYSGGIMGI